MTEEEQIKLVTAHHRNIELIQNPSEAVQIAAISGPGGLGILKYIENPSMKVQLYAVNRDAYALNFIKNPSNEIITVAIEQDPYAICYVDHDIDIKILEPFKHEIIKWMLTNMAELYRDYLEMLDTLNQYNLDWPELEIINKSVNASKTS